MKPFCSSPLFSHQWIPTSLQILQMGAVVMVPSWRLGLLWASASGRRRESCHHDLRHPWPLARSHDSICGSVASRGKMRDVRPWPRILASTDAGRNEALGLHEFWSVVDRKQVLSLKSWKTFAWQRQQAPSDVLGSRVTTPR